MIVGAGLGILANLLFGESPKLHWIIANVTYPAGQIFLRLIFMVVIPLILSALILGVAELGDVRRLGRVGIKTLLFTVVLSSISVLIGVALANLVRPGAGLSEASRAALLEVMGRSAQSVQAPPAPKTGLQILLDLIPQNPVEAMVNAFRGDIIAVMVFALFIGIAMFFALTSRVIPKEKRNLYVALYFLSGALQFVSDLFPLLPSPLNYINLLIPPSDIVNNQNSVFSLGTTRLGAFAASAGVCANFLIAKYGLKGIFRADRPLRFLLFATLMILTMLGGFRIILISYMMMITMLFFLEGLHRTRMLLVFLMGGILCTSLLVPFANKLPFTFQRALSFLPLNLDSAAVLDAEGSRKWREDMWHDTWPKVPGYLLLGKGYALSQADFQMMGNGQFSGGIGTAMDKGNESLAISGDYHNGPLSTLMPFGIWGAISFLWVSLAALHVLYRNFKYGDPELKTVNTFFLVMGIQHFIGFFFIFGAYSNDIGEFAKLAGFSIALNWRICAPKPQPAAVRISPPSRPQLLLPA